LDQTKEIDIEELILENEYDDGLFIKDEDTSTRTTSTTTHTSTTITTSSSTSTKESYYGDELDFGSDYFDYGSTASSIDVDENNENDDYDEKVKVDSLEDSDNLEVYFKLNERILNNDVIIKKKHEDLEINCFLIGNEKIVQQGLFKKIDEHDNIIDLYDKISQNITVRASKKITLKLRNLSKNDRGKYECGVEELSEKSKFFNLLVTGLYYISLLTKYI
jgi:hypothetical protein